MFGNNIRAYYRYLHINKALSETEKRDKIEEKEKEVAKKFRDLDRRERKSYASNQSRIEELDNKIVEQEHAFETLMAKGKSKDAAVFAQEIAMMKKEREDRLSKINKLETKSNNITGENINPIESVEQESGTSQLVVEDMQVGGEHKRKNPLSVLRGMFIKNRTAREGVKSAYDGLVTAQTYIESQETVRKTQLSQMPDKQAADGSNEKIGKQLDKGAQEEPEL